MANGITGGLESLLGIDTNAGADELKKALAALQGVQAPTAAQLSLPELQQYVQQGLLTPEQYQAIIADPEAYSKAVSEGLDSSGTNAQKAALEQLGNVVKSGGSTDINKANLVNNIDTTNQAMKASRDAIMQNAQERGVSGGGLDFIKQLSDEQGNAEVANRGAVNSAADNAKLALQALTQQGSLGGQLQSQADSMAQAKAQAAQQIAEYNSQLKSDAAKYNTDTANNASAANLAEKQRIAESNVNNANERTAYNAAVPQTVYQDALGKANDVAGIYGQQGQLAQKQASQDAAFTGNLIGAGATLGGNYIAGNAANAGSKYGKNPNTGYANGGEVMCYARGGEVHDHSLCMAVGGETPVGDAPMPGDSPMNDTIDAKLSPHEIVLPRSVSMAPDAPQKAAQFVGNIKGTTPTVNSFAEALKIMEDNGLELRLQTRD